MSEKNECNCYSMYYCTEQNYSSYNYTLLLCWY